MGEEGVASSDPLRYRVHVRIGKLACPRQAGIRVRLKAQPRASVH